MSNKPNMTGTRPRVAANVDDLIYGTATDEAAAALAAPAPIAQPVAPEPAATPEPAIEQPNRVIFTNQLKPEVYIQMRQYEYHAEVGLHEILHEALSAFFANKPEAQQPLPPKVAAKRLKALLR